VVHNLLGVPGASIDDIRTVISHPQALSQCQPFIRQHYFREESEVNTAVAAKKVAELGDKTLAAIASEDTAELYGLQILDHDINESKNNTTRFAVFARTENEEMIDSDGSTFIMLFRVNNVIGSLADSVQVISRHGFNMNVLRSRPIKTTPWKYYFYVEAEGNPYSSEGKAMIDELKDHCDMLKIVGQYNRFQSIRSPKDGEDNDA
jgi:chorismate mutase/prephenate dehydratase